MPDPCGGMNSGGLIQPCRLAAGRDMLPLDVRADLRSLGRRGERAQKLTRLSVARLLRGVDRPHLLPIGSGFSGSSRKNYYIYDHTAQRVATHRTELVDHRAPQPPARNHLIQLPGPDS